MPNDFEAQAHTPAERIATLLDSGAESGAHAAYNELRELYEKDQAAYRKLMQQVYKFDKQGVGLDLQPMDADGNFKLTDSGKDSSKYLVMGGLAWQGSGAEGSTATAGDQTANAPAPSGEPARVSSRRGRSGADSPSPAQADGTTASGSDEFDNWQTELRSDQSKKNLKDSGKAGEPDDAAGTARWLQDNLKRLQSGEDGIKSGDLLSAAANLRFKDGSSVSEKDLEMINKVLRHYKAISNEATIMISDDTISAKDVNALSRK